MHDYRIDTDILDHLTSDEEHGSRDLLTSLEHDKKPRHPAGWGLHYFETLTHEMAHTACMNQPLPGMTSKNLGSLISWMPASLSNRNELEAGAVTYLVMRRVCTLRNLRDTILDDALSNTHGDYRDMPGRMEWMKHMVRQSYYRKKAQCIIDYYLERKLLTPNRRRPWS